MISLVLLVVRILGLNCCRVSSSPEDWMDASVESSLWVDGVGHNHFKTDLLLPADAAVAVATPPPDK